MKTFKHEGAPQKLSKMILDKYPEIGYFSLQKLFRKSDIKVNGKRISTDQTIFVGDEVVIYFKETEPVFKILYEDENIFAIYKPKKIASQGEKSLEEKVKAKYPDYRLCHRLDTNTEGIILFAKNDVVFEEIKKQFKLKKIEKHYIALVKGEIKESGFYSDYLIKDSGKSVVRVYREKRENALKAELSFSPIQIFDGYTKVDIELLTGRTHQIRAQMAFHGHPVVGDGKYGDEVFNKQMKMHSQALVSYKLIFHIDSGFLLYLNGKEIILDTIGF